MTTTCKAWCGRKYEDESVPPMSPVLPLPYGSPLNRWYAQPAYCSQACLDAATAKPVTTCKANCGTPDPTGNYHGWSGTVYRPGGEDGPLFCSKPCGDAYVAKKAEKPVTTAPVERRLADGWKVVDGEWLCSPPSEEWFAGKRGCHYPNEVLAKYRGPNLSGACEACAPSMGVFVNEPTVTVRSNGSGTIEVFVDPYIAGVERLIANEREQRLIDSAFDPARDVMAPAKAQPCARCTHTHQGPCDGRSPFGDYSCPCGHNKAEKAVRAVGWYDGSTGIHEHVQRDLMVIHDRRDGATYALLANLAREKAPMRRDVKQVARYADGANLDWRDL